MKKNVQKIFILLLCSAFLSLTASAQYWFPQNSNELILKNSSNNTAPAAIGIGVTNLTAQLHTDSTVRLEGLVDTKDSFVVVTDPSGNINKQHIDSLLKGRIPSLNSAWLLTGNTVSGTDYIGTNNNQDFRIHAGGFRRATYTADSNYEFGSSNTFTNSQFTHLGGVGNRSIQDSIGFTYGANNASNSSNNFGIIGRQDTIINSQDAVVFGASNFSEMSHDIGIVGYGNRIINSHSAVIFGLGSTIDYTDVGGVIGEDLGMYNSHGSFMAGGHSYINSNLPPGAPQFQYNMSIGSNNVIDEARRSQVYGNYNQITAGESKFALGNYLTLLSPDSNVFAFGDSISNDLNHSMKFGFDNNRTMTLTERGVEIQMAPVISSYAPGHNLEVMAGSSGINPEIVFQDLPRTSNSYDMVVIDTSTFELYRVPNCCNSGGVSSSCTMQNMVPKVDSAGSSNLRCSQISDNDTTVGIGLVMPPRSFTGVGVGIFGPPAANSISKLDVNGLTFTNTLLVLSDARLKKDIKPIKNALEIVESLNGLTYSWEKEKYADRNLDNLPQAGFLAQEVEKVYPRAVVKDNEGFYAMNYNAIIPLLNEAIKEQQKQIESKDQVIQGLQNSLKKLASTVNQIKNDIATICDKGCAGLNDRVGKTNKQTSDIPAYLNNAWLGQNYPNPHSGITTIRYSVPQDSKTAELRIVNLQGKLIRKHKLEVNSDNVEVQNTELASGIYLYSLIVDNILIDSKRMEMK